MSVARRTLVAVLALPFGGGLAFLALEGIGVPLVLIAAAIAMTVARKDRDLPVFLVSSGIGFAIAVAWFAFGAGGIFGGGATDAGTRAWFAFWFLFGAAAFGFGVFRLARNSPS